MICTKAKLTNSGKFTKDPVLTKKEIESLCQKREDGNRNVTGAHICEKNIIVDEATKDGIKKRMIRYSDIYLLYQDSNDHCKLFIQCNKSNAVYFFVFLFKNESDVQQIISKVCKYNARGNGNENNKNDFTKSVRKIPKNVKHCTRNCGGIPVCDTYFSKEENNCKFVKIGTSDDENSEHEEMYSSRKYNSMKRDQMPRSKYGHKHGHLKSNEKDDYIYCHPRNNIIRDKQIEARRKSPNYSTCLRCERCGSRERPQHRSHSVHGEPSSVRKSKKKCDQGIMYVTPKPGGGFGVTKKIPVFVYPLKGNAIQKSFDDDSDSLELSCSLSCISDD